MTSTTPLNTLDESIFHNNFSLPEDVVPEVKSRLGIAISELDILDAQITEVKAKLASLTHQREQQIFRINRYKGALSISTDLPLEVLRELLIHCVHASGPMGLFPHPTDTRLVLTQVCSLWRTIICAIPALWCDYEIRAIKGLMQGDDTRKRIQDIMTACFKRANSLPINLSVKPFTTPLEVLPVYIVPDVLQPWANRFNRLDLVFPSKEVWYWAKYHVDSPITFPILTEFAIQEAKDDAEKSDDYGDDEEFSLIGWSGFPVICPSLKTVELSIAFDLGGLDLPWDQITTIHLKEGELTTQQCHDLWMRCPLLEDFSTDVENEWRGPQDYLDPISLLHLRKVSFTADSAVPCAYLFHSLEAPILRDLSITITEGFPEEDFTNLKNIPGIDDKLRELKILQGMQLEPSLLDEFGGGCFASLERLDLNFFEPDLDDKMYGPESNYFELVMKMLVDRHKYTEEQRNNLESGKRIVPLSYVEVAYQPYHWDENKEGQLKLALDAGVPIRMTWEACYSESG